MNNVDLMSFFGFFRPNLSPQGYKNRCFLVSLWILIVQEDKLGSSTLVASSLEDKNTGVVSEPFCVLKCAPTAIYSGADIPNNFCESFLVSVQNYF